MKYKYYTWYYDKEADWGLVYIFVLKNEPFPGSRWSLSISKTSELSVDANTTEPDLWEDGPAPVTARQMEFIKKYIPTLKQQALRSIIELEDADEV